MCDTNRVRPDARLDLTKQANAHKEHFQRAKRGRRQPSRLIVVLKLCQFNQMNSRLVTARLTVIEDDLAAVAVDLGHDAINDLVVFEAR